MVAGDSQLSLRWSTVADATGYKVYRLPYSYAATSTDNLATTTTKTIYIDKELINGTTYYYKVSAYNAMGESGVLNVGASGIPKFYCSVDIDTSSEAQTVVTVSGKKYYIDLDGVRDGYG